MVVHNLMLRPSPLCSPISEVPTSLGPIAASAPLLVKEAVPVFSRSTPADSVQVWTVWPGATKEGNGVGWNVDSSRRSRPSSRNSSSQETLRCG